jgi:endonuclease/exonuclease/phosphatase family metal-dependent hydrolase
MLKLIQLNAFQFTYFDQMLKFLKQQNADIITLQEATSGETPKFCNGKYLDILASELRMQVIYSPFTGIESQNGDLNYDGNAMLTKLEIVDNGTVWLHHNKNKLEIRSYKDNLKLHELIEINRNLAYPIVYNEPKNLIWALLKFEGKVFRVITTHFTATPKCTETLQMIQEADAVCSFIDNVKAVPTIFTGDLNIHQKAGVIETLKSRLELVNEESVNSLCKSNHQIFLPKYQEMDPSLKNGLSVDYVFQKDFKVTKWEIPDIEVSDHLPVIVELEV